jgi:hypothetical protein
VIKEMFHIEYFEIGEWKAASLPITGTCITRKPRYNKNCRKYPAGTIFVHPKKSTAYHDEKKIPLLSSQHMFDCNAMVVFSLTAQESQGEGQHLTRTR